MIIFQKVMRKNLMDTLIEIEIRNKIVYKNLKVKSFEIYLLLILHLK